MPSPETSRTNGAIVRYRVRSSESRPELRERCQENKLRHVEEHKWIAANSENQCADIGYRDAVRSWAGKACPAT